MFFSMKLIALILWVSVYQETHGYGRLIEPPSRSSMWRFGFNSPKNAEDAHLNCGGLIRQYNSNDGKCGVCGDAWDLPIPRPNENGGKYGRGVIVRNYTTDEQINIRINMTEDDRDGYFEFRICAENNFGRVTQTCLNKNLLSRVKDDDDPFFHDTRFYVNIIKKIYEMKYQLPKITCKPCVLQWKYILNKSWPVCSDNISQNGKDCPMRHEEFRGCADISINERVFY